VYIILFSIYVTIFPLDFSQSTLYYFAKQSDHTSSLVSTRGTILSTVFVHKLHTCMVLPDIHFSHAQQNRYPLAFKRTAGKPNTKWMDHYKH